LTPNEAGIYTADQVGTVPSNSLNTHKNGDDHVTSSEMYAVQSTNSASNKVSSVVKVVKTEHMKEFLVWPDTPKRNGKRQMDRQPYAMTSRRYQEMFEENNLAKRRAEEEKRSKKTKTYRRKRKEGQISDCYDYSETETIHENWS
jgi:hypothetical protein